MATQGTGRDAPPGLDQAQQRALTASQAVAAIQSGQLEAEAYVTTLLQAASARADLNCLIHVCATSALGTARAIDARRAQGQPLSVLAGLPIVVEDNIHIQGLPAGAGTPALGRHAVADNAPVLQALIDAGAIVLAQANMHELACGVTSSNPATGFVRNPYDTARIPGGSSGGTAGAIAARIAPAGLGSDTAGSTRIAAALCGVAGLRPGVGNGAGAPGRR